MRHKIGIYVRVSTEEQAQVIEGSIDNQQHRLKGFVDLKNLQEKNWGKIVDNYIDDGFSAKDTKRPAYQRMMRDIQGGKINLILVTDLSRLSRNIHDFSVLLKDLEQRKAKFLSVKEQFDTSTPAGEMMIYNMANLAQFERKQTSERISMNFHSRAMRGLLNGSIAILGYDKDPNNPSRYLVNAEEATLVRAIFKMYLELGSTYTTAAKLNEQGVKPKKSTKRGNHWTADAILGLLSNLAYVGKREVNKSRRFEDQEELKPWHRYQVVKASWPAIVSDEVFDSVQRGLREASTRDRTRRVDQQNRVFLLSGILRCKECGRSLVGQTAHGKTQTHRYYTHKAAPGQATTCRIVRVRADQVEDSVMIHLDEMLKRAGHLDNVEENIRRSMAVKSDDLLVRKEATLRRLSKVEKDLEALLEMQLSAGTGSATGDIYREKFEALALEKRQLVAEREVVLEEMNRDLSAGAARHVLENRVELFRKGWRKATPVYRRRLLRQVVESLTFTSEALEARYVVNMPTGPASPSQKRKMASEEHSGAISKLNKIQKPIVSYPSGTLAFKSSHIEGFGGG